MGTVWSLIFSIHPIKISHNLVVIFFIIYLIAVVPTIFSFFVELLRFKSKLKWIIITEVTIFIAFIIAPPRNADAMRVWLAKVFDVWMNGEKIVRPYWHYNTPDAFTLFHLPLINLGDGQVFQLSIWTALCALILIMIKIGKAYLTERGVIISLILFLFNPLIILASTVVITDIPIMLAVAGFIYSMIAYEQGRFKESLILVVLFTAFGMNIKYNMLMFLPAILYWSFIKIRKNGFCRQTLPISILLVGLAILPYLMNYINIGNPVWPALVNFFPSNNPYWDQIAVNTSSSFLGGERTVWTFIRSFSGLFMMPHHINPLAMGTVFFIFGKFKYLDHMPALIVTTYLLVLWLMMPEFAINEKERYVLYLFPIIIPLGVSKINKTLSSRRNIEKYKRAYEIAVIGSMLLYSAFTVVYSYDSFRYMVNHDKARWHRATWYYKDYDWINRNILLEKGDKILVIARTQQTYYLKKPYINGDGLSAAIHWSSLLDIEALKSMIARNNFKYIFVDDIYLKGHKDAQVAIDILKKEKVIEKIRENKAKLYSSRIKNRYKETSTILYRIVL